MIKEIEKLNLKAENLLNNNPDKSIEISISAFKKSQKINYNNGELNSLLNLAGANYRKHNLEKTTSYLEKAAKLLLHTDQFKEWVKFNNLRGGIFLNNNNLNKAGYHFEEAIRYAKIGKLYSTQILAMNNLALIKIRQSLFKEAIKILQKALLLGKKTNDISKQLFIYNLISIYYHRTNNYSMGMNNIIKTLALLEKNENNIIKIQTYNTKGSFHLQKKELKLANESFEACLKYAKMAKATDFIINSKSSLGETYSEMGKDKLAEEYFQKSLTDSIKVGHIKNEQTINCQLNKFYFKTKDYHKSIKFGNRALQLNVEIKSKIISKQAHLFISKSYRELKDFSNALSHYEKYSALNLELNKNERELKLKELDNNHKLESTRLEINLEKEKNKRLELTINKYKKIKSQFEKKLSPKELVIVKMYAKNFKRIQIAKKLNITTNTFDFYRNKIIQKLNLNGVDELLSLCKPFRYEKE